MGARLSRLIVSGLRCLHGLELTLEPLTALIGPNGAGKSSTVRALEFLFGQVSLDDEDCTEGLLDQEVSVTGVFIDISAAWAARLSPWLDHDGSLTLTRTSTSGKGGSRTAQWTTTRRQIEGFGEIRRMCALGEPVMTVVKPAYQKLREQYTSLPSWQNKQQVLAGLDEFEESNPTAPRVRDIDGSLNFGVGGEFDLSGMIELLVLPAFRDATDDATERRGSNLARLVELTVRSQMDIASDLHDLETRTGEEFRRIISAGAAEHLDALSRSITTQLEAFAPGTSVRLSWDDRMPTFIVPGVRARLQESGHEADIGRQGHGVQRAYVFSLLRALLNVRRAADSENPPSVVLVIEEPEVYQHPVRARYVARVLADLARDTDRSTQVIYTTHSPYFVSVDNIPSVRLLRLGRQASLPGLRATRSHGAALSAVAAKLDQARDGRGQRWTAEKVAASLPGLLGSDVSEGLFAEAVVLVEGEEDIGLIDGAATAANVYLPADGIALIAVGGKDRLRLAAALFSAFAVPTYLVFDTDLGTAGANVSEARWHNGALTWLASGTRETDPGTRVTDRWASAQHTLRAAVDVEIGAEHVTSAYQAAARDMSLPESTEKNGYLVRTAISALYAAGHRSQTLDAIVAAVRSLRSHS